MNIVKFLKTAFFIEHFRWLFLPFITTFWNYYWKDRWITVNKGHVHSTLKNHSKKVLGMLQILRKETQSLLLTFSIFHVLFSRLSVVDFEYLFAGKGISRVWKLSVVIFIKRETLGQVFFCEFCEIFKNTFFTEELRWLLLTFGYK